MEINSIDEARVVVVDLLSLMDSAKHLNDLPAAVAQVYLKECLSKLAALGDFLVEDDWDAVLGAPDQDRKGSIGLTSQGSAEAVDLITDAESAVEESLRLISANDQTAYAWEKIGLRILAPFGELALLLSQVETS